MINLILTYLDVWKLIALFILLVTLILCIAEIYSGKKDGKYEEMTEDIIKFHTGIDIDLTPNLPE